MSYQQPRRILVTSALPYANGPLHLGHMLEQIQTDIWVRFQQSQGNECYYICADDAHGTAIMLKAQALGITPEQLIEQVREQHERDSRGFLVNFDHFYSTHSDENRYWSERIYGALRDAGQIVKRNIVQAFDPERGLFLADRFIKGTCPKCKTSDQYGDNCESCGATYTPNDLIDPVSALSGAKPVQKESEHYFLDLAQSSELLTDWINSGRLQSQVANKLREWLDAGLQGWDISRDAPYFGFEIPDAPGKYFYVWLDAPIGYIASFDNFSKQNNLDFESFWFDGKATELYHFIGKDIINFHGLFWPAMLNAAGLRAPSAIYAHGFLTVNGTKMSKSRGTFINASNYLSHLSPEYLRYYFAAKLGPSVDDIDLNLEDFVQRVNSDVVGKIVNIASRCAGFLKKRFDNTLAAEQEAPELLSGLLDARSSIAAHFEGRDYNRAIREVIALADRVNQFIDEKQPWVLAKDEANNAQVHRVCSDGVQAFRILVSYLAPVLPEMAAKSENFLNTKLTFSNLESGLLPAGHRLEPFSPLMQRIEMSAVEAMIEAEKAAAAAQAPIKDTPRAGPSASDHPPIAEQIDFDTFAKVDLRVADIVSAEEVEGADKLLRLTVSLGDSERTIIAGIKSAYSADQLVGRQIVVVANLAPRKMRFGTSEGMALAAGPGGSDIFLLAPDSGARAGMQVK
ncbi:MAG: methionine--tRNA ligase [Aequoribacter sp.]|uniref:methionine--tRNA ligase n=1 Tax=Aequoribacter sp. TaxID=2847771 RepID=UPI003C4E7B61